MNERIKQSETVQELYKALIKAQAEFPTIKFDSWIPRNYQNKRTGKWEERNIGYASLSAIFEGIRGPLSKNGLGITQIPTGNTLTTTIFHQSGEFISADYPLNFGDDMQRNGGGITYARRYVLSSLLGIVTDEDDDGEGTKQSKPVQQKKSTKPKAKQQAPQAAKKKKIDVSKHDNAALIKMNQDGDWNPPTVGSEKFEKMKECFQELTLAWDGEFFGKAENWIRIVMPNKQGIDTEYVIALSDAQKKEWEAPQPIGQS